MPPSRTLRCARLTGQMNLMCSRMHATLHTAGLTWSFQEKDPKLPSPSDPKDVKTAPGQEVRMILVNYRMTEGWDE